MPWDVAGQAFQHWLFLLPGLATGRGGSTERGCCCLLQFVHYGIGASPCACVCSCYPHITAACWRRFILPTSVLVGSTPPPPARTASVRQQVLRTHTCVFGPGQLCTTVSCLRGDGTALSRLQLLKKHLWSGVLACAELLEHAALPSTHSAGSWGVPQQGKESAVCDSTVHLRT